MFGRRVVIWDVGEMNIETTGGLSSFLICEGSICH